MHRIRVPPPMNSTPRNSFHGNICVSHLLARSRTSSYCALLWLLLSRITSVTFLKPHDGPVGCVFGPVASKMSHSFQVISGFFFPSVSSCGWLPWIPKWGWMAHLLEFWWDPGGVMSQSNPLSVSVNRWLNGCRPTGRKCQTLLAITASSRTPSQSQQACARARLIST